MLELTPIIDIVDGRNGLPRNTHNDFKRINLHSLNGLCLWRCSTGLNWMMKLFCSRTSHKHLFVTASGRY